MNEAHSPNQDELNQTCRKLLLKEKQHPDPSQLYCLQLMEWALNRGVVQARDSRLNNTLEHLLGEDPEKAYRFLKVAEDGKEYPPVTNPESMPPEALAWKLLDLLDSKISLHLKDYPPGKRLP